MIAPNGSSTLFVIDAQGNFHRMDTTVRPLGPRSDLLMLAAASEGRIVPNIAKIGEMFVHLQAAAITSLAVVLPYLRIRTFYLAAGTGKELCMVPWFAPDNAIDFACDWYPEDDCKIVFVISAGTCFVMLVGTGTDGKKTIHRVPLPNIYDDGRICMGTWAAPGAGSSHVEIMSSALTFFATSSFNSDLIGESRTRSSKIMRFTIDGKQLPPVAKWRTVCPQISGASYNWVVNLPETTGAIVTPKAGES